MRINKFVALASGISRRDADRLVQNGHVRVNDVLAEPFTQATETDQVFLDARQLHLPTQLQTILLHKPARYVVSRDGQGSPTIYELLPDELRQLKPVGRLDKDSSGLLLLTNDGALAQELTHPSYHKVKIYEILLRRPLQPLHRQMIAEMGIQLADGRSQLGLERLQESNDKRWRITMHEGRNRQIRRTFAALGYDVAKLHRTQFGTYKLPANLRTGDFTAQ